MLFNWTCFICFNWTFNLQFYCLRKGGGASKKYENDAREAMWNPVPNYFSVIFSRSASKYLVWVKMISFLFQKQESFTSTSFKTYFHWLQNSLSPGQPQDVEEGSLAVPLCPTRRWPPPRGSREDGLGGERFSSGAPRKYWDILWKVCLLSFCQRQNFLTLYACCQISVNCYKKRAFFMVIWSISS